MPEPIINEFPVHTAGVGDGLIKILDAAKVGDPFSIVLLAGCALSVVGTGWIVIKPLLPRPTNAVWRRWRAFGLISLGCVLFSCTACLVWNKATVEMYLVPLAFVYLVAFSAKRCRDARVKEDETVGQESSDV